MCLNNWRAFIEPFRALLYRFCRPFNRPPQDEEAPEIARPPPDPAEIPNPMTMKPRIRDIFYTMELYVLFLKVMQLYQLNLEDFDHVPLGPPINQHDHRVRQMKEIYDELNNAKAIAGQPEFDENLIQNIRQDLIQRYRAEHDQPAPAGSNDGFEYIVDLLPDELRGTLSNESHAQKITQLICSPKAELYIDGMDSFKDIRNQVGAMYQHSLQSERTDDIYTWCGSFHKHISNGNCKAVKNFLQQNRLALTSKITVDGNTALHVAVKAKKLSIVKLLLVQLNGETTVERTMVEQTSTTTLVETLKKRNIAGKTALYIAASSGYRDIAAKLVERNQDILLIECQDGADHLLPLLVAAKYDNKETVKYIYDEMPDYEMPTERKKQWALFLANLIYNDDYVMALRIIRRYPSLALCEYTVGETPLLVLAQRPCLGANMTLRNKAPKSSFPTFICGNKMDGAAASKASELLKKILSKIDDFKFHEHNPALSTAFFKAAEVGSVEFVAKFTDFFPQAFYWLNDLYQNIFHVAIINRQEKIFNLIYGLGSIKNDLAGSADKSNDWMLHLAGKMTHAYRLNQFPGPAMHLQRELQWFQAVRGIVPNISIDIKNLDNKRPHELFVKEHEDLTKDGVKWMRNTASSCSIVAALITTVMFAAAFTLPGGNNINTGDPMFLRHFSFKLFVYADLVALSTSSTSVLTFLSILTSRFAQEDFLKSLPMRLMLGLVLLFFSIVAMMVAFCDAIYIIFQKEDQLYKILITISVIGSIPIIIFSFMMFPLLVTLAKPQGVPSLKTALYKCITRTWFQMYDILWL